MTVRTCFFLPTRKGSLRVQNKNTRRFCSFSGGLLENKLNQLSKCQTIDEIILSTNDSECIKIASQFVEHIPHLKIIERPDNLCLDTTNLKDLIAYVPTITNAEHIMWGHVTTPIFGNKEYDSSVLKYFESIQNGFDSLISVCEYKNFLLDKEGKVINNKSDLPWPRTQDLEALFEINHAVFLTSRLVYEKEGNRIGLKPYLHTTDKIKSFDVDWEDDFKIAEILYEKYNSV